MPKNNQKGTSFNRKDWDKWAELAAKEGLNTTQWLKRTANEKLANEAPVEQQADMVA